MGEPQGVIQLPRACHSRAITTPRPAEKSGGSCASHLEGESPVEKEGLRRSAGGELPGTGREMERSDPSLLFLASCWGLLLAEAT